MSHIPWISGSIVTGMESQLDPVRRHHQLLSVPFDRDILSIQVIMAGYTGSRTQSLMAGI
jgi:hypothetical protein